MEVETGRSEVSRSFGVGRRSKELEEAEVRAEVEEDDLFVEDREDDVLKTVAAIGRCSIFAETASRFDARRTVVVVDRSFSAFWCGVYSVSEFFLFRFLWVAVVEVRWEGVEVEAGGSLV